MNQQIPIIGAGIGGLCTAIQLKNKGFEPLLYEKVKVFRNVGHMLLLWPNATDTLQKMGVLEEVAKEGAELERCIFFSSTGKKLNELDLSGMNPPGYLIFRPALHRALLRAAEGIELHQGKELSSLFQTTDLVQATFSDGSHIEAKMLIGADGIHSRVRKKLWGPAQPDYCGYTVWRGISTVAAPSSMKTGNVFDILGPHGHVLAFPTPEGTVGWAFGFQSSQSAPDWSKQPISHLLKRLEGWAPFVQDWIRSTPNEAVIRTPICTRRPKARWGKRQITLLGDAAHPCTPSLGQSGCMAIEDAWQLAESLSEQQDPQQAFRHYEQNRWLRTSVVMLGSSLNSVILSGRLPRLNQLRNVGLQTIPSKLFSWSVKQTVQPIFQTQQT